jgi:hypothetical protein
VHPAVPGTLDVSCLGDINGDHNAVNGNGIDSGDYCATVSGATIDGTSTAVTGFTLIP